MVTSLDRFGLTLCLAILFHALVVLGITFAPEDIPQPRYETMEIILVQQSEKEAPEDTEFLGQANLEGGGDSDEKVSPSTPMPAPFPDPVAQETAPQETDPRPPEPPAPAAVESSSVETVEAPTPSDTEELLLAEQSPETFILEETVTKPEPVEQTPTEVIEEPLPAEPEKVSKAPPKKPIPERELPSAAALLTNSFRIASLSAEIRRKMESKAQRPKRKFISASTKEFKYAAYMEAWRSKVERVGNLNYPDEAKRQRLNGSLILDVALNADGSINEIVLRKSSGHKVLDDAAIRIVRLAAPYAPFPENFRGETDILHITRTWRFANGREFR